MAPPTAHIKHQLPGRVRLKIHEKRGDVEYFTHLHQQLSQIPEVVRLESNPSTGSVLIAHEGKFADLAGAAKTQDWFLVEAMPEYHEPLQNNVINNLVKTDLALVSLTNGRLDVRGALFTTFILLAIVQALRGNFLAPAASLFWSALETLRVLDTPSSE